VLELVKAKAMPEKVLVPQQNSLPIEALGEQFSDEDE
jgi:hypothetical protein